MPVVDQSLSTEEYILTLREGDQELARHVLVGGVNRHGKAFGFHHAPNGVAPPGRRIEEVLEVFPDGTYTARVSLWDARRGWVLKGGTHSMFPDSWSREDVIAAGLDAYRRWPHPTSLRWKSQARGIPIRGYRSHRGAGPATFFPDHQR